MNSYYKHLFQNAAVATGTGNAFKCTANPVMELRVYGITTATITLQGTVDDSNWVTITNSVNALTGIANTAGTITADGRYIVPLSGLSQVRANLTAWTTGTVYAYGVIYDHSAAGLAPAPLIGLTKAEDAAHASGDIGMMALAVRKDTAAALAGTDADYAPLEVDASGRLWTHDDVLDAAVSGSELQVDVVGALPAGTNLLGKVGIDQVTANANEVVLKAGTNLAGKVGIDQVTANANEVVLKAGTNLAGKVGIDQVTANANEVVVKSGTVTTVSTVSSVTAVVGLPACVQGPGNPVVDSYTSVAIDLAASTANQVLRAAPGASKQIWVYGLFMMADTAAGTVVIQDEDDTVLSGTMAVSDEGGWVLPMSGNFSMPWIKVATNKALEADTGAATLDGILTYAIVSV